VWERREKPELGIVGDWSVEKDRLSRVEKSTAAR
jgi:hypothetical protein